MEEIIFPKDKTEYHYYFRIKNIEEALAIYNKCNEPLLGREDQINQPVIKRILASNEPLDYYEMYKKLHKDFNEVAQKIISGDKIETKDDFDRLIAQLMIIANETIELTQEICYNNMRAARKNKVEYNGKQMSVFDVLSYNLRVPELINPDETASVLFNKYGRIAIDFALFSYFIVCALLLFSTFYYFLNLKEHILNAVLSLLLLAIFAKLFIILLRARFKARYRLRLTDIKSKSYSRKRGLVYRPFEKKESKRRILGTIKEIIGIIKGFK